MAAFTPGTFIQIGNSNSDGPRLWTYATADTHANCVASGYFDGAVAQGIQVNDLILAVSATGGTQTLTLINVDAISAAGVVTTLSTVQTLS